MSLVHGVRRYFKLVYIYQATLALWRLTTVRSCTTSIMSCAQISILGGPVGGSRDHRATGNRELIRRSALGIERGRTRGSWAWRTTRLCQGRCAAAPFRHVKFSSFLRRRWTVSLYERTPAAKSVERARKRLRWGRKRHNALGLERK